MNPNTNTNLVGLCGTHGTGKTSITTELEARGFAVDRVSLSRAAQASLGWSHLNKVEESEENMWALQDRILAALLERDTKIAQSGIVTFVDRTPVDLIGYVNLWADKLDWKIDRQHYQKYYDACWNACRNYVMQWLVIIRDEIPFVVEDNRADEASRVFHQNIMLSFMINNDIPFRLMTSLSVNDRAEEILSRLNLQK